MTRPQTYLVGLTAVLACATPSSRLSGELPVTAADAQRLDAFTPRPDGRATTVNYDLLDEVLGGVVLVTGPSLRKRANRPTTATGTRILRRHDSKVRLEGNKIIFSLLNDQAKELLYDITDSLVDIGNREDIAKLSKDEQLAYWYNLHNMLVISTILKHYPAASPSMLTVGESQLPFHEAPVAVIKGVPLSLRDIRVGIVYRNWKDPNVMYGFFHGDLASPNLRARAWKASKLKEQLAANAGEFVNSLRGVRRSESTLLVSRLYGEGRGTLFVDWPKDLRTHLARHAQSEVAADLGSTRRVRYSRYEHRTADMVGGKQWIAASKISAAVIGPVGMFDGSDRMLAYPLGSPSFALTYSEFLQKFIDLRRAGKRRTDGEITITDLPSDDGDENGEEAEDE